MSAMFDIWLMLELGVVGYVVKKIGIPLSPLRRSRRRSFLATAPRTASACR